MKWLILSILSVSVVHASGITTRTEKYERTENSAVTGKITVDLGKMGQSVDKNFYGSHLDSTSAIPAKEMLDELQLGKLRIGGNEYDVFNWKTGYSLSSSGEMKKIRTYENTAQKLSQYKIDGIYQINLTGYQPEAQNNGLVMKQTFTAQSAYELIKHLNGNLKLNLVDFSLGNEFSIWHETFANIWPTQDGISADEYIDRYIQFALAIRKAQKEVNGNPNSIKIWGPEISSSWLEWNTGNMSVDCEWTNIAGQVACSYGKGKFDHFMPYFLSRLTQAEADKTINPNGFKLLDYLAIHYYPNFRTNINDPHSIIKDESGRQRVAEILEATRVFNSSTYTNKIDISSFRAFTPNILTRMKEWMKRHYPDAKLAMNEFAVDSDYRTNSYHPIIRPLYLADSIGIFAKENVAFLNQFILNSEKGSEIPWSMIEGGTVRKDTFYMYKLFTNNFKGTVVSVDDNLGETINGYATIQGSIVNLALVNKSPVDTNVQIYIKENGVKKVANFLVPGWSASILKLDKNAGAFTKSFNVYQFGATEMGITKDPAYIKK